jgi:hypothetical protein
VVAQLLQWARQHAIVLLMVGGVAVLDGIITYLREQRQLNDSTQAVLAATRADREQLAGLLTTAEEINGKLVAGLRIRIPARDTVIIYDTLETTRLVDSSRVATFRDSTFAGTIAGTINAPPYPAPLGFSYELKRPEFNPAVGFVQVGDRFVATVTWQGEQAKVEAPFFEPPKAAKKRERPWFPYAEVGFSGSEGMVRTGVQIRFWNNFNIVTSVERFGAEDRAGLSLRREFR